jgi:hypothetical protein
MKFVDNITLKLNLIHSLMPTVMSWYNREFNHQVIYSAVSFSIITLKLKKKLNSVACSPQAIAGIRYVDHAIPFIWKIGTNFADKRRPLGRYYDSEWSNILSSDILFSPILYFPLQPYIVEVWFFYNCETT